ICYTVWICCCLKQTFTHTNMSIDACIAHAIHSDLDIVEALPEVTEIPVEELEPFVERFVVSVQETMRHVIQSRGEKYLLSKDPAGLCATCLEAGLNLPPAMLLKMCRTIMQLSELDAKFILDTE